MGADCPLFWYIICLFYLFISSQLCKIQDWLTSDFIIYIPFKRFLIEFPLALDTFASHAVVKLWKQMAEEHQVGATNLIILQLGASCWRLINELCFLFSLDPNVTSLSPAGMGRGRIYTDKKPTLSLPLKFGIRKPLWSFVCASTPGEHT